MKKYYPVNLDIEGKAAAVVGGGKVAERKVKGLLEAGADVTIISPEITEGLRQWEVQDAIAWRKKEVSVEDLQDAAIVVAATNDAQVNEWIASIIKPNQLVNLADNPEDSDFHTPSIIRRGGLVITVSTSGASPMLSRKITRDIAELYDERYEDYLDFLFAWRERIIKEVKDPGKKRKLLAALVEQDFLDRNDRDASFRILYEKIMEP
ncbi:precorrin-2 dehydrogenase/sirohydrochlorin ferrochelatase family protein [Peribacillus glennii]|uniref:precorrin-2 dehydrogenase n=1 Tax=Peribacillus glennii TaxID=2303991 RepID=A0A372LF29_9BACI|nr:NAD(P)-dependent oxidoreductase [Peribacillus glennii]RFU63910.1 siroheme synthase [Peribacillus glennii]